MNSISFERTVEVNHRGVEVLIDGTPLRELLQRHELPYATKEGRPDIAGSYACLGLDSLTRRLAQDSSDADEWGGQC
jgi:hypothetical protein